MIIQMVAREVGEPSGGEFQTIEPALLDAVGGSFQRGIGDAAGRQHGKGVCQGYGVGRGQAVGGRQPFRDQPQRAERRGFAARSREELAQEIDRTGLAVGAGHGGDALGHSACQLDGELRQFLARGGHADQLAGRHAGWPNRALRRQHGDRAARYGLGDITPTIRLGAGECREHETWLDCPAVRGDSAYADQLTAPQTGCPPEGSALSYGCRWPDRWGP